MKFETFFMVVALLASSSVMADSDLCADPAARSAATSILNELRQAAINVPSIHISSAGFQTCDPTTLVFAGENGGVSIPAIALPPTCGAVFTFKNDQDMGTFAKWVYTAYPEKAGSVCVSIDFSNHLPGVSGSNSQGN